MLVSEAILRAHASRRARVVLAMFVGCSSGLSGDNTGADGAGGDGGDGSSTAVVDCTPPDLVGCGHWVRRCGASGCGPCQWRDGAIAPPVSLTDWSPDRIIAHSMTWDGEAFVLAYGTSACPRGQPACGERDVWWQRVASDGRELGRTRIAAAVEQDPPRVAIGAAGDDTIVFYADGDLLAQRMGRDGTLMGDPTVALPREALGYTADVKVGANDGGFFVGLHVAPTSDFRDGTGVIRVARTTSDGARSDGPVEIASGLVPPFGGGQSVFSVATARDLSAVAWTAAREGSVEVDVRVLRASTPNESWSTPTSRVLSRTAVDGDGLRVGVAWNHEATASSPMYYSFVVLNADGSVASPPVNVREVDPDGMMGGQYNYNVAWTGCGWILVTNDYGVAGVVGTRPSLQTIAPDGRSWDEFKRLECALDPTSLNNADDNLDLASDGHGLLGIAWPGPGAEDAGMRFVAVQVDCEGAPQ